MGRKDVANIVEKIARQFSRRANTSVASAAQKVYGFFQHSEGKVLYWRAFPRPFAPNASSVLDFASRQTELTPFADPRDQSNMSDHFTERAMRTLLASIILAVAIAPPAAAMGNLANLEIFDRQSQRTLPIHWHEGRAYVEGKPGNEYRIALRNRTPGEILAVVSVDGVNVVTGETAAPHQGGYVLDSASPLDITGWRKSLPRTAAFLFTELADSYAARTGRPENVGVIGVALFRRKPPVEVSVAPAPKDAGAAQERNQLAGAAKMLAPMIGTGHGRSETSHARRVAFERATDAPEETLTIYYDRRENLVARGILREPPVAWRTPRAFPGSFVADPPAR
jgi:hypothetical protein